MVSEKPGRCLLRSARSAFTSVCLTQVQSRYSTAIFRFIPHCLAPFSSAICATIVLASLRLLGQSPSKNTSILGSTLCLMPSKRFISTVCSLRLKPGQQLDRYVSRSKMVLGSMDNLDKLPAEKVVVPPPPPSHSSAVPSVSAPSGSSVACEAASALSWLVPVSRHKYGQSFILYGS